MSADMSLQEMTRRMLASDAARPVLNYEGRWYSLGELRGLAQRIGELIEAAGGDASVAVTFVPRNRPEAIAGLLALLAGGRSIRMVYAFQSAEGIARDVERLRSGVLLIGAGDFGGDLRRVVAAQQAAAITLADMGASLAPGLERCDPAQAVAAPDTPQIQILTSGTTGTPKQFPISHDMVARHHVTPRLAPGREEQVAQEPPALLYFPIGNISGIYSTVPALLRGQRVQLLDRFSLDAWRAYIRENRPVMSGGPPAAVQMILDAEVPKEELVSLRYYSTGAAPLDPTVQAAFEQRYGIPVLLSYGATEFGGPVCAMTPDLHAACGGRKPGTLGKPLPGASLRVVDGDSGEPLPAGQEGLLEVISPRLEPKWIRTSDIGRIDEDGFLFLCGRADGAIMRGGFKVLPETIERALLLHPAIAEAAVVGVADRRVGQVPAAAIRFKPGVANASVEDLEAHLRRHLLSTHIPVHWKFVAELPRNASVKIDRRGVMALFA